MAEREREVIVTNDGGGGGGAGMLIGVVLVIALLAVLFFVFKDNILGSGSKPAGRSDRAGLLRFARNDEGSAALQVTAQPPCRWRSQRCRAHSVSRASAAVLAALPGGSSA